MLLILVLEMNSIQVWMIFKSMFEVEVRQLNGLNMIIKQILLYNRLTSLEHVLLENLFEN